MKDFMMKHPFISLLMLSEVCTMVTNVCRNSNNSTMTEDLTDIGLKTGKKIVEKIEETKQSNKDPVGFKVQ